MATLLRFKFQIVLIGVLLANFNGADSRNDKQRISEKKCHEYAEYKEEPVLNASLSLKDGDAECTLITQSHFDDFLNEKRKTAPGLMKYPHMALIGYNDPQAPGGIHWACGGSLISESYVLTAAQCLQESMKYVLLGELDISTDDDIAKPTIYTILEKIIHPNYNDSVFYNDIALLKLNESVHIDEFVRPICLHQVQEINAEEAVATGWGLDADGRKNDHLQEVELDLISFENCTETYSQQRLPRGIDDKTHLCAGSYTSAKDTCVGDGGGPLQIYHSKYKCMFDLIGITSFGFPECGKNKPGVYTRVSNYLNWIEEIVWPQRNSAETSVVVEARQQTSCDGWSVFCFFYEIFH